MYIIQNVKSWFVESLRIRVVDSMQIEKPVLELNESD